MISRVNCPWQTLVRTLTVLNSSSPLLSPLGWMVSTLFPFSLLLIIAELLTDLLGRHVVFGEVLEGFDVVQKIENTKTGRGDKPTVDVVISGTGELNEDGEVITSVTLDDLSGKKEEEVNKDEL
jgi:cyclophilin family peptidyl-prolyl cis-trans isomerase